MTLVDHISLIERKLQQFKLNKIGAEERELQEPALIDPAIYSNDELENDLDLIDKKLPSTNQDLEEIMPQSDRLQEPLREVDSDRKQAYIASQASGGDHHIDLAAQNYEILIVFESVISGIDHVRDTCREMDIDLSVDDDFDPTHIETIETELREYLLEEGYNEDTIRRILGVLDILTTDDDS